MRSNPGGDRALQEVGSRAVWAHALPHREPESPEFDRLVARFTACEISPEQVHAALVDGGDALYAAAASGAPEWADEFGGPLAVALLAAELSAFSAQLNSRASGVRSLAVDRLLDDFSAVTVAAELGISRQKVYEVARAGLRSPYFGTVPWRKP